MNFLTAITQIGSIVQGARSVVNGLGDIARSHAAKARPVVVMTDQQSFDAHLQQAAAQLIESRDANGDGTLSAAESGLDRQVFAQFDTNGDGKLDALELTRAMARADSLLIDTRG